MTTLLVIGALLVVLAVVLGGTADGRWHTVVVGAGFTLLAVGILGLVLDTGLARLRDADPGRQARPAEPERTAEHAPDHGFRGVRGELDVADVLRHVEPGQELWWMDTFPLTLSGDLDTIHRALGAGVRVRLLVLDPRSPALSARLREIHHHYGLSVMDLRRGFDTMCRQLRTLADIDGAVLENLEVRAYDGLPGAPMFLVARQAQQDGAHGPDVLRAFSSYYLLEASQDMPYLEWDRGPLLERLDRYFQHKWNEAHTVFPLESTDRPGTGSAPQGRAARDEVRDGAAGR